MSSIHDKTAPYSSSLPPIIIQAVRGRIASCLSLIKYSSWTIWPASRPTDGGCWNCLVGAICLAVLLLIRQFEAAIVSVIRG